MVIKLGFRVRIGKLNRTFRLIQFQSIFLGFETESDRIIFILIIYYFLIIRSLILQFHPFAKSEQQTLVMARTNAKQADAMLG